MACPPCVRWTPAHLDAPGQRVSERDRRLNREANEAACAGAHRLRVPAVDRAVRCDDLCAIRGVSAAIEMAALVAKRGARPSGRHRRRYLHTGEFVRLLGAGTATPRNSDCHPAVRDLAPWLGHGVISRSPCGSTFVCAL